MHDKYKKKYADLHIHSTYSDGTFTPAQIFEYAKKVGIYCVSITDHDTIAGIDNAILSAKDADIEFIPGIEFSVNWKYPTHILGYYFNHHNKNLRKRLDESLENRTQRAKKIIAKLAGYGLSVDYDELINTIKITTPGRPHIAQYLINKGIVRKFDEAFDKYLTPNKPGYVEKDKLGLKETIDLIKNAGGIAVLAHPLSMKNDDAVEELLRTTDIEGIEVYYTTHKPNDAAEYLRLAEKYKLLVTGGSDCHGKAKEEVFMGKVKLKYEYIERLKEYLEKKTKN